MTARPIRLLIVDDSATVRRLLSSTLGREKDIQVVGEAADPYQARELVVKLDPDVLTLDVEMPRMDGLSFLAKLMQHRPKPVIVVSSLTPRGSEEAMRAYELGAVEVLCKPGSAYRVEELGPMLARAVRTAAVARLLPRPPPRPSGPPVTKGPLLTRTTSKVLAIGASTGGTEAIRAVMQRLPGDTPGTVIVQHMPPMFTSQFAQRLDGISRMRVAEARGGEELLPGLAFVAPGGHHLAVVRSGAKYLLELRGGPMVHFQKPAVDVTFRSLATAAGANAVGVVLTGMGHDGAAGLKAMRDAGARTLTQDEKTSVVWGMPGTCVQMGAAEQVLPLDRMPDAINALLAAMA
ncbi:MAG TPA: chemotaxis response regulator protein-glutamate methylesterase [Planctomycetes bacterium]|nr:chemotaxis response regulator protein-glutamate methylesterase [Planctomycetota bacterium]